MTLRDRTDRIEIPWQQRVAGFTQRRVPVVIWFVCVLICGRVLLQRAQSTEHIRLDQVVREEASTGAAFAAFGVQVRTGDVRVNRGTPETEPRLEGSRLSTPSSSWAEWRIDLGVVACDASGTFMGNDQVGVGSRKGLR